MNTLSVSIVIVSFNTEDLIKQCLNSIAANTKLNKDEYEIIMIDNNSQDSSVQIIEEFKNSNPGLNLSLIKNKQNLGFARAVNQGIDSAQGENIFLLNSDTQIKPGSIQSLLEFSQKKPDSGVVGPRLVNPDGTPQPSCYNFPTLINAIKEFWFGQQSTFSKYYPRTTSPTTVDALVGAAFLITKQALKQVGKLNQDYFLYYEDIDYCKRVWHQGLKVYYYPQTEIIHHHGASGKKISSKTKKWLIESSKKYHGLITHYLITFVIWSGQKIKRII
jgi:hypothetical protein